ncbi:MAG: radical SAM family heme chaperone HemW [Clostridia bacterium]|nr:radical SAM family heme chaperone HemW [Clostridia bacterium]
MRTLGLYLHIPFCKSKCLYCDFCSSPNVSEALRESYVAALCRDLQKTSALCKAHTVDTVYLGGGTPTVLTATQLEEIMETVFSCYRVAKKAEITAECNPATASRETLSRMRRAGINRLSIGLQSAHAQELKALGRLHDFARFRSTWEDARAVGFDNLSVDVMSGIPHQTRESYLETLRLLCALSPEHVSAYGLIVEEGTPFGRMAERLPLPDEETARAMYFDGIEYLASQGLFQYEISNFARAGYESRHNLKYWDCDEFLGFGPAAYSDFGGERFGNTSDVCAYIDGKDVCGERERVSVRERANEYVMLRMRLCKGISRAAFEGRFGMDFSPMAQGLERYVSMGLVSKTADGYAFSPEGMYVSNAILSEILDFS